MGPNTKALLCLAVGALSGIVGTKAYDEAHAVPDGLQVVGTSTDGRTGEDSDLYGFFSYRGGLQANIVDVLDDNGSPRKAVVLEQKQDDGLLKEIRVVPLDKPTVSGP